MNLLSVSDSTIMGCFDGFFSWPGQGEGAGFGGFGASGAGVARGASGGGSTGAASRMSSSS